MIELDLHPEAHRDYEAAYDWYAKQDLSAAEAFDAELCKAAARSGVGNGI